MYIYKILFLIPEYLIVIVANIWYPPKFPFLMYVVSNFVLCYCGETIKGTFLQRKVLFAIAILVVHWLLSEFQTKHSDITKT